MMLGEHAVAHHQGDLHSGLIGKQCMRRARHAVIQRCWLLQYGFGLLEPTASRSSASYTCCFSRSSVPPCLTRCVEFKCILPCSLRRRSSCLSLAFQANPKTLSTTAYPCCCRLWQTAGDMAVWKRSTGILRICILFDTHILRFGIVSESPTLLGLTWVPHVAEASILHAGLPWIYCLFAQRFATCLVR